MVPMRAKNTDALVSNETDDIHHQKMTRCRLCTDLDAGVSGVSIV